MKMLFKRKAAIYMLTAIAFVATSGWANAQAHSNWTKNEKADYETISQLCNYMLQHNGPLNITDPELQKFIAVDYVLNDNDVARKEKRIAYINELLGRFRHYIDSAGIENLDAKPVRFYKTDSNIYQPFQSSLEKEAPLSFAYFSKNHPHGTSGFLLFDEKTKKLLSWIMINQGGHYYFLTFNLI